jgi:hypothetical protein
MIQPHDPKQAAYEARRAAWRAAVYRWLKADRPPHLAVWRPE